MKEKWNFILYLVWFAYLILSAVLMFGQGFLLSRKTMSDITECRKLETFDCNGKDRGNLSIKDTCSSDEKIQQILNVASSPLLCIPSNERIVFILVDALRYDFTEYDENLENPLPYQNRLPVMQKTLERCPDCTRLFRFIADPPTTTLQRVKALVTGSLPTFIDASSNFAAMELQEDNVIDQIVNADFRAVLLGDDTWSRLMPRRWLRSHTMYSFHTWDLDTVDTEVDSKIYDEIKHYDWDLLVAHYLGVDHAGHRYGPNHSEMKRKLDETNARIEKIIEVLPEDVTLYVVGDHGMTETGDHGGESKAERTAAMFAYRGSGFGGQGSDIETGREVQQTDLAPTMSAVFGLPPPAPSLGNVLLPVLPKMTVPQTLLHLVNNLKQVSQYLVRYGEESQQVSLERLAHLINATREQIEKAASIKTEEDLSAYITDVRSLMDNVRNVFRDVWVEFDTVSMLRALLLLILVIFFNWLITEGIPMEHLPNIFASSFVPCGFISLAVCISICYTAFQFQLLEDVKHGVILSTGLISSALTCVLVIMHWDNITQRWYEGRSPIYERFSRSTLMASAAILLSNSYIIEEGAVLAFLALSVLGTIAWNIGTVKVLALWVAFGTTLAMSRSYRGCREEQGDCWTSIGTGHTGQASRAALVMALGSMAAVVAIARRHVGWRGHGVVLAGLFACAHWALGWGALGSPSRSRQLARGSWLILGSMFVLLWKREKLGAALPLIVCSILFYIANALALGASYAPSAALGLLAGYLAINIVSLMKNGNSKFSLSVRCSSSVACMWALLASYQFYGTGHHATLGHVRWAPAFHAGDPNYLPVGDIVIGALVALELFGMPFMFGAAVPLLALWGRNGTVAAGPRTQMAAVFTLCLKFGLCFAIRVFMTALSATIHCRHLMIWGVFTPKLLFESGTCAAALLGTIVGAILTAWHIPTQVKPS